MSRKFLIPSAIILLLAGAGAYFYTHKTPAVAVPRSAILITIDTLRADHLGAYGYALARTPNLDRMAREGVQFMNSTAAVPLTLPSHSTIMTGVYPPEHGVRDNGGYYLDNKWVTLAETMKSNGFATGGFVSAFVLDRRWGIAQGFDEYFDHFELSKFKAISMDAVQRRGDETLGKALDWIRGKKDTKFFAWIHFYDPHTPYDPPEPFRSEFAGQKFGLYDGEIAFTDSLIGRLRDFLKEQNIDSTTMIILTADHGESLGEHEETGHGFFIYDATTHVPLLISIPGEQPRRVQQQVRSIDLYPTFCDAMRIAAPTGVRGTSLMPLVEGRELAKPLEAYSESYYARFHYGWSELKSLRTPEFKFIQSPRPEFYRVSEDSDESDNLYDSQKKKADPFGEEIARLVQEAGNKVTAPKPVDEDSLEKLQALGYIGSFNDTTDAAEGSRADPKDKIRLYNLVKLAQWNSAEDKTADALVQIKQVIAEDPGIIEAHLVMANLLMKQKDSEGARRSFQDALKLDPNSASAIFGLASAYEKDAQWDSAKAGFERLFKMDGHDTKALYHLGDIALAQKKEEEALEYFQKAVAIEPEQAISRSRLGACYLELKRYDEAAEQFKKALELNSELPNVHFNYALVYEEKGQIDSAVAAYKQELAKFPEAYPAHFNLARIYRQGGDRQSEKAELEECIRQKPEYGIAYLYLAKNRMDAGGDLAQARSEVQEGLEKTKENENLVFGYYVLADILNRMGHQQEALAQAKRAQELEKKM